MNARSVIRSAMSAALCAAAAGSLANAGPVIYVDADATGAADGSSWTDAYTDLQNALAAAAADPNATEIWVAEGTYKPAGPGGDQSASFRLISGVGLYGGFAGVETQRDQRDPPANLTTLSGDLNGDDDPNFANREDNSEWVVSTNRADMVNFDGFTVTGATETGLHNWRSSAVISNCTMVRNGSPDSYGGGISNEDSESTITHCVFQQNRAGLGGGICSGPDCKVAVSDCGFLDNAAGSLGGGMYNDAANVTIADCEFSRNVSIDGFGGALFNDENSYVIVNNTVFTENAAYNGGAIFNNRCMSHITGCEFTANHVDGQGGGIADGQAVLTMSHCAFRKNTGYDGAGFWLSQSIADVHNCHFYENTGLEGAGIYIEECSPTISESTFQGNTALDGGAVFVAFAAPVVSNCLISDNAASGGAGVHCVLSTPSLLNCTVSNNRATRKGGGIYNSEDRDSQFRSTVTIANSLLWNNAPQELRGSDLTVRFSFVAGGYSEGLLITDADPMFVDPDGPDDDPATVEDNDYSLLPGSPAINAGDNLAVPADLTTDLIGNPRFDGCRVDLGAYEFVGAPPADIFADLNGDGTVNISDLGLLLNAFGQSGEGVAGDLDQDGTVDMEDFSLMLDNYGAACF